LLSILGLTSVVTGVGCAPCAPIALILAASTTGFSASTTFCIPACCVSGSLAIAGCASAAAVEKAEVVGATSNGFTSGMLEWSIAKEDSGGFTPVGALVGESLIAKDESGGRVFII
jgi:hypothetical protein